MKITNILEAFVSIPSIILIETVDLWHQVKDLALHGEFDQEQITEDKETSSEQTLV